MGTGVCIKRDYKGVSLLYSDDELTPYDMSGDQKINEASPPRYLRDCLEGTALQI